MTSLRIFILLLFTLKCIFCVKEQSIKRQEKSARDYLKEITPTLEKNLLWMYENQYKDKSKISLVEQISQEYDNEEVDEFFKKMTDRFKEYKFEKFNDTDLSRQILLLTSTDERVLSNKEKHEFKNIQKQSKNYLENIKFCDIDSGGDNENENNCNLNVNDILGQIILSDDKLNNEYYWKEFTSKIGKNRRDIFDRYIQLYRKIAELNGYETTSHFILREYEDKNIIEKVGKLVEALKPLYMQFHAYIRNMLHQKYGDSVSKTKPISYMFLMKYYLLSESITEALEYPFPNSPIPDYDLAIENKNYTPQVLIEEADKFFTSMGIGSVLSKDWKQFIRHDTEADESGTCQPQAKSYLAKESLTFTYCNKVDFRNFYNSHAQMLIVQQYNHGQNLPLIYRSFFPPAFEKALEKTMKFAVSTPKHMTKIGIIDNSDINQEVLINRLFLLAFKIIVDILQSYSETIYIYKIMDGNYNISDSNCEYWKLQQEFLGIQPFATVYNKNFDYSAFASENFPNDGFENIVARFAAFNIYEAFCKISGNYETGSETMPLNNCDFSGSHDVGRLLVKIMKTGASKPWYKILKEITLKESIDASSMLQYFEPLRIFLENENKKNGVHIGWESTTVCH